MKNPFWWCDGQTGDLCWMTINGHDYLLHIPDQPLLRARITVVEGASRLVYDKAWDRDKLYEIRDDPITWFTLELI